MSWKRDVFEVVFNAIWWVAIIGGVWFCVWTLDDIINR